MNWGLYSVMHSSMTPGSARSLMPRSQSPGWPHAAKASERPKSGRRRYQERAPRPPQKAFRPAKRGSCISTRSWLWYAVLHKSVGLLLLLGEVPLSILSLLIIVMNVLQINAFMAISLAIFTNFFADTYSPKMRLMHENAPSTLHLYPKRCILDQALGLNACCSITAIFLA